MRCFTAIPIGLLCCLLFIESGVCRPESREEEQNDAEDEPNDEQDPADQQDEQVGPIITPVITSIPQNMTVEKGETVTLPCDVKDLNDFQIMWLNGTSQLFLGTFNFVASQPRITRSGNALVLGNVSAQDSGVYTCKVLVSKDFTPSISYNLQVKLPAAIKKIEPSGKYEVMKGKTLSLTCEATGFPTPQVKWIQRHRKGGKDIEHKGSQLTVVQVSHEQSGIYECIADNGLNGNDPPKDSVEVVVLFEPEINIQYDIISTAENVKTELICTVHGHPTPKVKWFKVSKGNKNSEIIDSDHHKVSNMDNVHVLRIDRTNPSDFGTYYCNATNVYGSAKKEIKVYGTPLTPKMILLTHSPDGRWSKITWQIVSSAPILNYNLTYRKSLHSNKVETVHPPVQNPVNANVYELEYTFSNLEKTSYIAILKAQNAYGWSAPSDERIFVGDLSQTVLHENIKSKDGTGAGVQSTISLILLLVTLVTSFRC